MVLWFVIGAYSALIGYSIANRTSRVASAMLFLSLLASPYYGAWIVLSDLFPDSRGACGIYGGLCMAYTLLIIERFVRYTATLKYSGLFDDV